MTSSWNKFQLLLWKNWTIQKRHYIQTLFEILIPVLCCSMLILVRGLVDPEMVDQPTVYHPMQANYLVIPEYDKSTIIMMARVTSPLVIPKLAYSPKNVVLESLLQQAIDDHLWTLNSLELEGYGSARDLEGLLIQQNYFVGVEFDDSLANITSLPDKIHFSLRFPAETRQWRWLFGNWRTNLLVVPFSPGIRNGDINHGGSPSYYAEGFIPIQAVISAAIMARRDPDVDLRNVLLRRIPYPPYYKDELLPAMEQLLPLIILIAFFYTCINTVKYITIEKERQLKEAMKIMGLSSWLHWTAWFVRCLILLLITISLVTVLMTVSLTTNTDQSVLQYTEWSALWVFLLAFAITTICFCFMMSVFFNKANTAAGIAGLMWFLLMMPYNITVRNYDDMGTGSKIALCLLSNTAMSYGVLNIVRFEGNQAGLQWSNMFTPSTMNDGLSVGVIIVMLLADALIYLCIALYFEQVMPGEFGVAKPWYFLFTREFWKKNKVGDAYGGMNGVVKPMQSKYIEEDPPIERAGVRIRHLRKVYGKKVAVDGLDLNMYEDQITVLLGHNGAGKTTTMSMLTGMFSPTSGTALINGHDIRTDIEGVRLSLGLCPQHNVLFNELTVAEHVKFFAKLKGVKDSEVAAEVEKYVNLLELTDKMNAQSRTLSGGMKRKLAVGVALCGGSKVVLLDEPSSGMDPSARRALWELLQKEKLGRTVLLSTHFMDEADVLGDRIAIMAEGQLKAVGTPFFLKKSFGAGYRLICVKEPNCNKHHLLEILRDHIPDVEVETDIGSELTLVLREDYVKQFQPMLENLEDNMESCGISSFGISLTTMEEVFLRSGTDNFEKDTVENGTVIQAASSEYSLDNLHLLTGNRLLFNQIKAQFLKKSLVTFRSLITLSMQILIPIVFVLMTYIIILNSSANQDLPALDIKLESYTHSITVLEDHQSDTSVRQSYSALFDNLNPNHQLIVTQEDMNDFILRKSIESIATVNTRYWVGATLNSTTPTAWFNNKAFHSAPLSINLLFNAFLQSVCPECEIQVTNKPLPFQLTTRFDQLETGANSGFQLAFNTGFAMAFVAALYIMFYIRERTTRSKLLQFVSGVNVALFWAVSFIWDYLVFVVVSLFYLASVAAIQQDGWSSFEQLCRVFLVLLLFGFAVIPTTYLFSYLFDVPATGFVKMMLLNIISGSVLFTAVTLLKFEGIDLQDVAEVLEWVFMLFPNFVLSRSLNNLNMVASTEDLCAKQCELIPMCTNELLCLLIPQCCGQEIFTFDEGGINRNLLFLVAIGVVAFGLIMFIEFRVFKRIFDRKVTVAGADDGSALDSDVLEEKRRIAAMSQSEINSYNLVLKDLSKYYKKFRAVNNLSVGIRHSECFGLLGINGAGKTSTFKMMTGDESISGGQAWVNGISLQTNMNRVHQQIGYCPQFDALLEDMTGRETLKMFALLRGVENAELNSVSLALAEELNFLKHIDKKTREYSGGNKRKLSTALALIGNPAVVYLDEPTTGMDPGAKRQFWNVICKIREAGKAIVLTSHSMEECEALCTRLAIMVNGEFKCLGSTQHLKNKFSEGFLLTVKVKREPSDNLQARMDWVKIFVEQKFIGAELKEEYLDSLSFHIPRTDLRWSAMFGLMEAARDELEIEDYALGQTSLEQVFLYFTKYQREDQ